MAVYTRIERAQLIDFLEDYDLGTLESFKGIEQGVSNTNYHVYTDRGHYVLTLCEAPRTDAQGLPFYFSYMQHLAVCGIPCPAPIADCDGNLYGVLAGKPAALMNFIEGRDVKESALTPAHCRAVGQLVAAMHVAATEGFVQKRLNGMGLAAWQALATKVAGRCDEIEAGLDDMIAREITFCEEHKPGDLPGGAVHTDVFPDNVLFSGDEITGILDFYFSCTDFFVFDLAIVMNAWCFNEKHDFVKARFVALMEGYEEIRALSAAERDALPVMGRAAALRVLVTRAHDKVLHDPANFVQPKDPREYSAKLRFHQKTRVNELALADYV